MAGAVQCQFSLCSSCTKTLLHHTLILFNLCKACTYTNFVQVAITDKQLKCLCYDTVSTQLKLESQNVLFFSCMPQTPSKQACASCTRIAHLYLIVGNCQPNLVLIGYSCILIFKHALKLLYVKPESYNVLELLQYKHTTLFTTLIFKARFICLITASKMLTNIQITLFQPNSLIIILALLERQYVRYYLSWKLKLGQGKKSYNKCSLN